MSAFNTVDQVVQGMIDKFPERYKPIDYWPMVRHALSWFNQRDRLLQPSIATVEIQLQADRTAQLPADFIDWIVVGERQGEHVVNLCFNERVNRLPPLTAGPVPTTTAPHLGQPWAYYGYLYSELYGYGGGVYPVGEFTVDVGLGKLFTNSEVEPGPLYLQYTYNPDKPGEATPISTDYMMPLELWIEWQRNRLTALEPQTKRAYYDELKRVSTGEDASNIETWFNLFNNRVYGQIG